MRRTAEEKEQVIKDWHQSGLSKKAFCQQHNITYQTFQYWCKHGVGERNSGFTEIKVESFPSGSCEIIFPSGTRVIFQAEPTVSWLRELVR